MIALRTNESNDAFEIDTERELEAIHAILYENVETLKQWKSVLEGTEIPAEHPSIPTALQDQAVHFPNNNSIASLWSLLFLLQFNCFQLRNNENPEQAKQLFYNSLQEILRCTILIEKSHDEIVNRFIKQVSIYPCLFSSFINFTLVFSW